jgi:hypothetical protein
LKFGSSVTGQRVVGEIQRDFVKLEVGIVEFLLENDFAVAVVACERRRPVVTLVSITCVGSLNTNSAIAL